MNSTRVALFFNTFVDPVILDAIAWKYYIVYCVILVVISVTISLLYPETKGYTLEETAALFGPDVDKNIGESRKILLQWKTRVLSAKLHMSKGRNLWR